MWLYQPNFGKLDGLFFFLFDKSRHGYGKWAVIATDEQLQISQPILDEQKGRLGRMASFQGMIVADKLQNAAKTDEVSNF